jgi:hypothetical protein
MMTKPVKEANTLPHGKSPTILVTIIHRIGPMLVKGKECLRNALMVRKQYATK